MPVASIYENGGIIGQTLDFGSTEQYISGVSTPSFVGSATGGGTLSLTGITGLQEGDLVVIFAADDTNCSLVSTGWTTLAETNVNSIGHVIAYKVMGATPDTSVSFSGTGATTATAWRGVEYGSIGNVVSSAGNSTTIDPSSISVTLDNSVVLVLAALDDQGSATVSTAPTGYTVGPTAFDDGGCAQLYKTGVSAGTEDPSTLTWSASDAVISYTLLLQPTASFGNFKNSGIWNLNAVYAYFSGPSYDYESAYGTPDYTITTFPSTGTGVIGSYDVIVAVDANISSTDDGVLFDLGGNSGAGMAAGVNNGILRVRAFDSTGDSAFSVGAGQAHLQIDISSYTGSAATYYFVVDASSYTLSAYVQVGGANSTNQITSLGSDTADGTTTNVYGTNDKGYGQLWGFSIADLGAAYEVNFNGTLDEIRIWTENAALDVSGFGA